MRAMVSIGILPTGELSFEGTLKDTVWVGTMKCRFWMWIKNLDLSLLTGNWSPHQPTALDMVC